MNPKLLAVILAVPLCLGLSACVSMQAASMYQRSSALEFLYPDGKAPAAPASAVELRVPLKVGIAFAPAAPNRHDPFTELQRQRLLERVAEAFRDEKLVARIDVIPGNYLRSGGGFEDLDRLRSFLGIDLVALVSYEQKQFSETTNASWTYLTVVGAFLVKAEKNETRTVMDTVVYDIPSRVLLFRAAGDSTIKGRSTPVSEEHKLREASESAFDEATGQMITSLETSLATFKEQVKTGTVRGPGTPAIQIVAENGSGGIGAGALGGAELLGLAGLLLVRLFVARVGRRGERCPGTMGR